MNKHGYVKLNKVEQRVFEIFKDYNIFLIGGSVRDKILGRDNKDYDFATSLLPEEIENILKNHGYKANLVGAKFGVVVTKICKQEVEISTFRKEEIYDNSRFPTVTFGNTLESDIARRDFTCNSLAVDRNGEILSYNNGYEDIKRKVIRTVGYEDIVFHDDPLRMLRAIRFVSQLGFKLDDKLRHTIKLYSYLINTISRERWKMEIDKFLVGKYFTEAFEYFMSSGLVEYILPELCTISNIKQPEEYHHKDVLNHTKLTVANVKDDVNLKWTMLLHDIGKAYTRSIVDGKIHFYRHEIVSKTLAEGILDRFKFSNKDKKQILFLIENHMRIAQFSDLWTDKAVRKLAHDSGEYIYDLLECSKADITSARPERVKHGLKRVEEIKNRLDALKEKNELKIILPTGIGNYVMEICNIPPCPMVGFINKMLTKDILDGKIECMCEYEYYKDKILYYYNRILTDGKHHFNQKLFKGLENESIK